MQLRQKKTGNLGVAEQNEREVRYPRSFTGEIKCPYLTGECP